MRAGAGPTVTIHEPGRTPLHLVLRETLDVGRECDGVLLTDAELSRRHLRVSATVGRVVVEDLGSTNGTTVDGAQIVGPTALCPGQIVRFGRCQLVVVPEPHATRDSLTFGADSSSIEFLANTATGADFAPWVRAEGTVALVVSDIEQWTRRVGQLGDVRASSVGQVHRGLVRRSIERWGGAEIGAHDDAFILVFPRASVAAHFSVDVMRALAAHARSLPADAIRLRIGVHCGEIGAGSPDVLGDPVLLTAWIASQATGGEVLVSGLVREILETSDAVTFGAARYVRLADDGDPYGLHPMTVGTK